MDVDIDVCRTLAQQRDLTLTKRNQQPIPSLEKLSTRALILALPRLCEGRPEPLAKLPSCILNDVMQEIQDHSPILGAHQVEKFISWNTRRLNVIAWFWTPERIENLLNLIDKRCKNHLINFEISLNSPLVSEMTFHIALSSYKSLQVLQLKVETKLAVYNDQICAVIGANLEQLRELEICGKLVTDVGIGYLCVDDGTHGKCKNLQHLDLQHCISVTSYGFLTAVEKLPELKYLKDNKKACLFVAILMFAEKYPQQKLVNLTDRIKIPSSRRKEKNVKYVTETNINIIISTVPNLRTLKELHDIEVSLANLFMATKLTNISMYRDEPLPHLYIENLTEHFGSQLTKLKIELDAIVDIGIIAHFCPNLIKLEYCCPTIVAEEYSDFGNKFTKLESIELSENHDEEIIHMIPVSALFAMLSSKYLKIMIIQLIKQFNDDFLYIFLNCCDEDSDIFSSIQNIVITDMEHSNLSINSIVKMICYAPHLLHISATILSVKYNKQLMRLLKMIRPKSFGQEPQLDLQSERKREGAVEEGTEKKRLRV